MRPFFGLVLSFWQVAAIVVVMFVAAALILSLLVVLFKALWLFFVPSLAFVLWGLLRRR